MTLSDLIRALKAGEELENSTTWKNIQATANSSAVVLAAIVAAFKMVGIELHVTPEELTYIASGVAGVLGVFNTYATIATSKKVGIPVSPSVADTPNTKSNLERLDEPF
jgi:hypothetical protein